MVDIAAVIAERDALRYLLDEMTSVPEEFEALTEAANLSAFQKRVLGILLGQPDKAVTRDQITAALMVGRPFADWPSTKVVDAHVCNIRKRLGADSPIRIETVWGIGYSATIREAAS